MDPTGETPPSPAAAPAKKVAEPDAGPAGTEGQALPSARKPREPKPPGPLARFLAGLPRPLRIFLQVIGGVLGLGFAGVFAIAWFASTEDLTLTAGEASTAVSPGVVTLTYADDLECVPEPNTIYTPSAFSRWQQSHRLVNGEWQEDARNFWEGEPESLDSDTACGDSTEVEINLPEGLPQRVALCRLDNGCIEVAIS